MAIILNDAFNDNLPSNVTGNGVARPKHWLVAQTHIHHEKKVSLNLTKMGIENFLPIQKQYRQWSDRRKLVEQVVIPMKIFVHVDAKQRAEVLSLYSVSRYMVLYGESTPAVVPDNQMDSFKLMMEQSEVPVEMSDAPMKVGEAVRVIKGALKGFEGELVIVNGKTKVAVRLPLLGCAGVEMAVDFVERISPKNISSN
ncbi:MAG: UpxY family transcription antiterminator [Bacteroides sp.]